MDAAQRLHRGKAAPTTSFLKSVLFGALWSLGVHAFLLIFAALIAYNTADPAALLPYLGFLLTLTAAFVGGLACGRKNREKGILCGLACGVAYLTVLWMVSLSFPQNLPATRQLLCYAIALGVSVLGGYTSTHGGKKKRRLKRK